MAFCAAVSRADLTIVQRTEGKGIEAPETTTKFKRDMIRVDVTPELSNIYLFSSGDFLSLLHLQRIGLQVSGALEAILARPAGPAVALRRTGRSETISGYECAEYEAAATGGKASIWFTGMLPPEATAWIGQLARIMDATDPLTAVYSNPNLPGFPIRAVTNHPEKGVVTTTIVKAGIELLPETDFTVPPGYRARLVPKPPDPPKETKKSKKPAPR